MLKRTALLSLCRKHSSSTSKSRLKNFLVNCILLPLIFVGHWILTSNMQTAIKNITMKLIALGENKKLSFHLTSRMFQHTSSKVLVLGKFVKSSEKRSQSLTESARIIRILFLATVHVDKFYDILHLTNSLCCAVVAL